MKNLINFQLSISQKQLSSIVTKAIDNAIGENAIMIESFQVSLKRIGKVDILPIGKNIKLELPYDVHIHKKSVFSIDAIGSIKVVVNIAYDISSDLILNTKTTIVDYRWLEKPKIKLGIVNIPVEKILAKIVDKYKTRITQKVDDELFKFSNIRTPLKGLDKKISIQLQEIDFRGIAPNIELQSIYLVPIKIDNDELLHLRGGIKPNIYINDVSSYSNVKDLSLFWLNTVEDNTAFNTSISLSYTFIAQTILDNLPQIDILGKPLQLIDISLKCFNGIMNITTKLRQPISANVVIKGIPSFDFLNGLVTLDSISVDVIPDNIIYKMTAPFINSFVKNKLTSIFPLSTDHLIKEKLIPMIPSELPYPMGVLNVTYKDVKVHDILFSENRLEIEVIVNNLFLSTIIDEKE